jgi:hypothetical protein
MTSIGQTGERRWDMNRKENRELRRKWDTDMSCSLDHTIFIEHFPFYKLVSEWSDDGRLYSFAVLPHSYA